MTIAGLKAVSQVTKLAPSRVDEAAVSTTVELLKRLDLVDDEQALRDSLGEQFARLTELGYGRLYVELPAVVTFAQLLKLADDLAVECGYDKVYRWPNFWVPGTERESVTDSELNGSADEFTARLALFATDPAYDPLLHFTPLPYDGMYRGEKRQTQLEAIDQFVADFADQHRGATLRLADHRDFLVWYIMDLLRGVEPQEIVLARGFMRVPALGRRTAHGHSCVGRVDSSGGQAGFGGSHGRAYDGGGVGLSAGFEE